MAQSGGLDLRRRQSVYTDERLAAITAAVNQWYFALAKPRNVKAKAQAQTSNQTVSRWREGGGLKPVFMARLWRLTQNPVFLLTEDEKRLSARRSYEIPKDIPTREVWDSQQSIPPLAGSREPAIKDVLGGEPSLEDLPGGAVAKMVIANTAIMTGGLLQIEELVKAHGKGLATKQVRQKAVALIARLISTLGLSPSDFEQVSSAETDPGILASWSKLLSTLS